MKTLELHQGHIQLLEHTLKAHEWKPNLRLIFERLKQQGLTGTELERAINSERDAALDALGVSRSHYFTMCDALRRINLCDELHIKVPDGTDLSILDDYFPNGLPCELKVTYVTL